MYLASSLLTTLALTWAVAAPSLQGPQDGPPVPCRQCVASWDPVTIDFVATLCIARAYFSQTNGVCYCDFTNDPPLCRIPSPTTLCTGSVFLQCSDPANCLGGFASVGGVILTVFPCGVPTPIGSVQCGFGSIQIMITVVDINGLAENRFATFKCPACSGGEC